MANWCNSRYVFERNHEDIEKLKNLIFEARKIVKIKQDFGPNWLGNVLVTAGLEDRIERKDSLEC
ncbi:MAG: hypothetical protein LUE12_00155 [Ruminococcus sp.]|nr:hypothetical protein [Ruminococcus sp.]